MQLCEPTWPENLFDLQLSRPRRGVNGFSEPPSLGGEPDHTSPTVDRIGDPRQVPVSFQMPEQVVDRLLRYPHTIRELTRSYSLEAGIAPERDMGRAQIVESRG